MTRKPYFFKRLYQTKFRGNNTKTYKLFGVPIGNAKNDKKCTVPPSRTTDKVSSKDI